MAHFVRSLFLAVAAGAAGGATVAMLRRESGKTHPLAKGAVVAALRGYQRVRSAVGELSETMSDIVAEAQSEVGADAEENVDERSREQVVPFDARQEAERRGAQERERQAHG